MAEVLPAAMASVPLRENTAGPCTLSAVAGAANPGDRGAVGVLPDHPRPRRVAGDPVHPVADAAEGRAGAAALPVRPPALPGEVEASHAIAVGAGAEHAVVAV